MAFYQSNGGNYKKETIMRGDTRAKDVTRSGVEAVSSANPPLCNPPSSLWTHAASLCCLWYVNLVMDIPLWRFLSAVFNSSWNLEKWFLWREENRRTRRKTLRARTRTNNKLNSLDDRFGNRTRTIRVGGERSHFAPSMLPFCQRLSY